MTIKDMLLKMGMLESDIEHRYSDLYVKRNEISVQVLSDLYHSSDMITLFKSDKDGCYWYEIPFGYMSEYIQGKLQARGIL